MKILSDVTSWGCHLHQHTNDTLFWPHLEHWTQFGHHSIRTESCKRASQGGLWNSEACRGNGGEKELRSLGLLCPEQRRMSNTSEIHFKSPIEKERCYFTRDANTWWKSRAQVSAAPSVQDKTAAWLPHWNCPIQQQALPCFTCPEQPNPDSSHPPAPLVPTLWPFSPLYSALKKILPGVRQGRQLVHLQGLSPTQLGLWVCCTGIKRQKMSYTPLLFAVLSS